MLQHPPVLAICGPTASGKTELAARAVAALSARGHSVEIVCCDSMQVYRRMDVGTAKPGAADRAATTHHCIDLVEPWTPYSAADYQRDSSAALDAIAARGAVALVVGGTGLYLRGLLGDVDLGGPPPDPERRERLDRLGHAAVVAELQRLDRGRAARTDLANPRRVLRAVELALDSGPGTAPDPGWTARRGRPVCLAVVAPSERATLYERIDARVEQMLAAGWLDEVAALVADPRGMSRTASAAIGYAELAEVVRGDASLDGAVTAIRRRTRGYARRQLTWFRREPRAEHHRGDPESLAGSVIGQFERALDACTSTS
ncbi:MAG: tRNA (adenosine(37)-N6)-dimethylallyltransferase MiaA [Acidimicrobiia bacterium]|nr:tRNA (adenosine(37)-N6)-dimethylallyltransferase MiaA [Acidimicrobiia bacterium]